MHETLLTERNIDTQGAPSDMAKCFRGNEQPKATFDKLVAARTLFVRFMRWPLEGGRDGDDYDPLAQTSHFYDEDEHGEIISTMRLTEVDANTPGSILSLEMLKGNPSMHERAKQGLAELSDANPQLKVYDLTRLVPRLQPRLEREDLHSSMLRMFVPAMIDTALGSDNPEGTVWVFSVTDTMSGVLSEIGIDSTMLASGKVSASDRYETEFCYISPYEATKKALESSEPKYQQAKEFILRGLTQTKSL